MAFLCLVSCSANLKEAAASKEDTAEATELASDTTEVVSDATENATLISIDCIPVQFTYDATKDYFVSLDTFDADCESYGILSCLAMHRIYDLYITICNGDLLYFLVVSDENTENDANEYAEKFISSFTNPEYKNSTLSKRSYDLDSGSMTVYMSEDKYDVFTTNNYNNKIALERQGYDQSRIDLYMAFSGYALQAVPVGDELGNSKILYRVNIKKREYGAISGKFERRFATIMNGKMTYIFVTVANEEDQVKPHMFQNTCFP